MDVDDYLPKQNDSRLELDVYENTWVQQDETTEPHAAEYHVYSAQRSTSRTRIPFAAPCLQLPKTIMLKRTCVNGKFSRCIHLAASFYRHCYAEYAITIHIRISGSLYGRAVQMVRRCSASIHVKINFASRQWFLMAFSTKAASSLNFCVHVLVRVERKYCSLEERPSSY